MKKLPRIIVTMGEPAGIGPELLVKLAQHPLNAEVTAVADPALLESVAAKLSLPLSIEPANLNDAAFPHKVGTLRVVPIVLPAIVKPGELNVKNAPSVLQILKSAGKLVLEKRVDAVVTAPVHKAILNQVDSSFLGHTEFFAKQAGVDKVVMMLATHRLRIALATTHIPLNKVSQSITRELVVKLVKIIDESFTSFGLNRPKIAVCGINPHAGEDGLLGKEDEQVVKPAINSLKNNGIQVEGPFPADSLFTENKRDNYDVFLAMYHDQGLPVVKAVGFGQCANITLGLPYIRTSVDHGTALDIAGKGIASVDSLLYATNYACQLAKGNLPQ